MSQTMKPRGMLRFLLLTVSMLASCAAQARTDADKLLVQLEPPRIDTLPAPENERCANYARIAVDDYATMRRFPQCSVRDTPRWQSDYRKHYQWCLTAPPNFAAAERKKRDRHLVRCGVRKSY